MTRSYLPSISTSRKLLYSAIVTASVLGFFNAVVWKAENVGMLDTRRPDDMVHHLDDALFIQKDGNWITSQYAEKTMLPLVLPVNKEPDDYRLLLVGGSFAMGTPYSHQRHKSERPGGIAFWLRRDLQKRFPDADVQVINIASGGQSSTRVRHIVDEAVALKPDVVVVASCNNESSLTPNFIEEQIRQFSGVRFLSKLLRPSLANGDRPELYSPTDKDSKTLARHFKANMMHILKVGEREGFAVLLSTLPVNLLYQGEIPGRLLKESNGQLVSVTQDCKGRDCPHNTIENCANEGANLLRQGLIDEAEELLRNCDDLESFRWLGQLALERNELKRGKALLEQYVELVPRGRCRTSFNNLIRESAPKGRLVDFQRAAQNEAGITPQELFVDNCHLSWVGYSIMAEQLLNTLEKASLLPAGRKINVEVGSRYEEAKQLGLPDVLGMEKVGGPSLSVDDILTDPRDPWGERKQRKLKP